jgi:choline transport protein
MVVIYLQVAWFVTMVVVAASAPVHNDSKFVFRTWINNTGWENNVICFITGLVNPMYSLGGLDGISVGYSHSEAKEDVNHFIAYH